MLIIKFKFNHDDMIVTYFGVNCTKKIFFRT